MSLIANKASFPKVIVIQRLNVLDKVKVSFQVEMFEGRNSGESNGIYEVHCVWSGLNF